MLTIINNLFIKVNKVALKTDCFVYIIKQRGDTVLYDNINLEIGKRIYERRKQLGITQEYLAELADTTPQAISNYERGERELKVTTILKISSALKITTDYLLTGDANTFSINNDFSNVSDKNVRLINEIVERCIELTEK